MKEKVIIIPVHNQLPYLEKCVKSVFAYTKNFQLIIVDDGSSGETEEWIRVNEKPLQFKRIRHEKALGFTKSCNDAIDYAMANFDFHCLCLLNSDAEIVTQNWFDKVERNYRNENDKIGISGVMSDNAMAQTVRNIKPYLIKIETKPTVICNVIHGFCYFIGKNVISTLGHMDNIVFPDYGSEDDYSLKAIQQGFINLIVGSVFVKHNNETSYTHETRQQHIKKSLPNFQKRWGYAYVDKCVKQAIAVGKYINDK